MIIRLTLRDYRCFLREQPAVIEIIEGFTAYVGPNNAGKSTILKAFYELRPLFSMAVNLYGHWADQFQNILGVNFLAPISDAHEIINNSRRDPALSVEIEIVGQKSDEPLVPAHKVAFIYSGNGWQIQVFSPLSELPIGRQHGNPISGIDADSCLHLEKGGLVDIRPIQDAARLLTRTLYIGAFRNAINEGAGDYFDLKIGTSFIQTWHHWKTGASKQQNRAMVRVTSEIARVLGARSLEINASMELKTLQIRLDDEPYKLSELGSGIAELIIVLANAVVQQPAIIAIDEPEAHLHPKLQMEFLTTLGGYAETAILFSTHVLGLARAIADKSFSVQRKENRSIVRELNKTSNYAEFLGSLGLAALQDVGYDTILLVEGVTEVRTFQQFLRFFEIDHRVVVLPLGGSSLINGNVGQELAEIVRMCPRVFAIIDSERLSESGELPKDRREFMRLCKELNIVALATKRTAIENYFTDRAVKNSRGERFAALGHFEKPNPVLWGKPMNWTVARAMTIDELLETDLGQFLNAIRN